MIYTTDSEIMDAFQYDLENPMRFIINEYSGLVWSIVSNNLGDFRKKENIEDCVSEIFLEFFENRDKICLKKGSIKSYLCVIAKRRSIDYFRKHCKRAIHVPIEETSAAVFEDDAVIESEQRDSLIKAIKELGEPDSALLIRRYYFGQSSKAIAAVMELKVNTVDKRISRALLKLKKKLEVDQWKN